MKISDINADVLGKHFSDCFRILMEPGCDKDSFAITIEGVGAGDKISYDACPLDELASEFRNAAEWLESINTQLQEK